ncbi:uncharacterized protein IUM83_14495 [Phytophthora cinnamomi]|uniref:uncharacterized protein n=1 Tax=Phytophthora cinnamomi TaxID=4785 RepID=UPI00355ABCF8|nr:hypothetical protein IUM83_14495 [Phytophthora cinnamomi]
MSAEPRATPGALALLQPAPPASNARGAPKKKPRGAATKKRRGWGPFHSVLKERSVDFNLTLDVQSLQQQVQDLATLRDILSTRTLLHRHSPEGSLFHVVKEYLRVFRSGWAVQQSGRKRLLDDQDQRAFLHSVMDPQLDVGNGLRGPDVMAEQIIMYSTFVRFIQVTLQGYDIVAAEDSVVIRTQAKLRLQVLRETIEMIFPHVIGDECLVAQLVGREVEPDIGITFSFNAEGKCCKYEFEVDFVGAFASIVKDPRKLEALLGKALIADNCMLGLLDEPVEMPGRGYGVTTGHELEEERTRLVDELQNLTDTAESPTLLPRSRPRGDGSDAALQRVVDDYFFVFAKGYRLRNGDELERVSGQTQDDFIAQVFVPERAGDPLAGGRYVQRRWRALSECFDVLEFQQKSTLPVEYNDKEYTSAILSTARYVLRITPHTIESVFPHILSDRLLASALVGNVIVVASKLVFTFEITGRISRVVERMGFVEPMATLLQNREDLSFVMSQALLCLDGVSCYSPPPATTLPPLAQLKESSASTRSKEKKENCAASTRTMTMADILHP